MTKIKNETRMIPCNSEFVLMHLSDRFILDLSYLF